MANQVPITGILGPRDAQPYQGVNQASQMQAAKQLWGSMLGGLEHGAVTACHAVDTDAPCSQKTKLTSLVNNTTVYIILVTLKTPCG